MADEIIVSGEFRTTANPKTTFFIGETPVQKELQYASVDGMAVFEGDIILGTEEEAQQAYLDHLLREIGGLPVERLRIPGQLREELIKHAQGQVIHEAVAITGRRWPDGIVPFLIDPGMSGQERVTAAIAHWEANTVIRFRKKVDGDRNFVRFEGGAGCSSAVGCRGGEQKVTLGDACTAGNAIHEIGHTVGLWHEQSREDRDGFIGIDASNITPGTEHNFRQHIADGDDIGGYDFGSIMHYPLNAFAIDPSRPTIIPRQAVPAGATPGQRKSLSAGDIAAVHKMYP